MSRNRPFVRFITRKWPPAVGGMETYSVRMAEQLPKYCEMELIALPGKANGDAPSLFSLARFGLRTMIKLLFQPRKADVTHLADMALWPLGAIALLFGRSKKVVLSAHGTDVSFAFREGRRHQFYRRYLALALKALPGHRVIANSRATANALGQLGFRDTVVVPLAADAQEGPINPSPDRHLLFAGRIIHRKGLSWFVNEVLPLLPPEITLRVAGPIWDKSEAECLSHDRVTYMGILDQETLKAAYAMALGVIVPNLDIEELGHLEGFGLVATEAAAAGAVVVAAKTGGLQDAVLDGETGFLLTAESATDWAARIKEIAGWTTEQRSTFLERSRLMCATQFSWDRVARETSLQYCAETETTN